MLINPDFYSVFRKKCFRRLARQIGLFLVFSWFSLLLLLPGQTRTEMAFYFENGTYGWALLLSAYFLVVCISLYRGHSWAWWGAAIGFLFPMMIVAMWTFPFMVFPLYLLMHIVCEFFLSAPRFDSLIPTKVPSNLDDVATSLGLVWQDQSLWRMVQLAQSGKVSEAVKQYRAECHGTWDQAEQTIKFFMISDLELKMHLLKLHVQSLQQATLLP